MPYSILEKQTENQVSEEVLTLIHERSLIEGDDPSIQGEEYFYIQIEYEIKRHILDFLAEYFRVNLDSFWDSSPFFSENENAY